MHSRPGSKVVLTGQYSWSDQGPDTDPSLSDPGLNWRPVPKNINKRGTNIEGANVQWGDGTTNKIFMPGTAETVYINMHARRERSRLTFDYNGPVTLGAPIGGGEFHDTLAAPGAGDVVIKGTRGNDVTFAAVQHYDGSTTVEKNARLRLGSGRAGGDGGLLTTAPRYRVVNDGNLTVNNTDKAISLSKISGSGSLTQAGTATTTLTGATTYKGRTTVSRGTLALTGGSLRDSSGVRLTGARARLDLRKAGAEPRLRRLSAVKGATVLLARGSVLRVGKDRQRAADLKDGAEVAVGGRGYKIDRNGDTVTLTATGRAADGAMTSATVRAVPPADATSRARPRAAAGETADGGATVAWWVAALGAVVLAAGTVAYRRAPWRHSGGGHGHRRRSRSG